MDTLKKETIDNFKYELLFYKYKDHPVENRNEFRKMITKKYGEYERVNDLIIRIEMYQFNRYGEVITFR